MASKRCIPTTFFSDPDVVELSMPEQLILIGLVLDADDSGRGVAHATILGRKLGIGAEQIESALDTLQRFDFIQCYQTERHRYYWLCRWDEWQSLSKPTPSKYPAPPSTSSADEDTQEQGGVFHHPLGNPGKPRETQTEEEGEEEQNPNEKRIEDDGEGVHQAPPNVVHFPALHTTSTASDDNALVLEQKTRQVAAILKLTVNDALTRIVAEYHADPTLSLLGEADGAREWIEDRQRNKKGQRMSPAFFRRWLKREHEDALRRQAPQSTAALQATGTSGVTGTERAGSSPRPVLPASLMHLQQHYQRQAAQAHHQTQEKTP